MLRKFIRKLADPRHVERQESEAVRPQASPAASASAQWVPNPCSWVAIDFETASTRATPCAVGMALVEDDRIVGQESWLIRPPIFEFSPMNVAIHGITPEMCEDAPAWSTTLDRILEIASSRPLVAHNAAFDTGVVRDACQASALPWPELEYVCTVVVGRRLWPELDSHSLPYLASYLGIEIEGHHDPEVDAVLAAQIGLRALAHSAMPTWHDLAREINVNLGTVTVESWSGCRSARTHSAKSIVPSAGVDIDLSHGLYGKSVAFTGNLTAARRDAQQAVVDVGGKITGAVTGKTDYLVAGDQDLSKLATGADQSSKLRKAKSLRAEGHPIEIVTESEFSALLAARSDDDPCGEDAGSLTPVPVDAGDHPPRSEAYSATAPGLVNGRHFTEWVETAKQLRREERVDEAEELLLALVAATESQSKMDGLGVAPWYYEQLAILYRKSGRSVREVEILERYAGQDHALGRGAEKLAERLEKARRKLAGARA